MKKNSKKPETFNIIPPDLSQKEQALELAKKDIITFGQMFLPEDFMKSKSLHYITSWSCKVYISKNSVIISIVLCSSRKKTIYCLGVGRTVSSYRPY